MTSSRPYLVRALYEWISDNDYTPYILVDATQEGVVVPTQFVNDGKIVLNISSSAVIGLDIENEFLSFSARFSGTPMEVITPIGAVLAIYARENGKGMVFGEESDDSDPDAPPPSPTEPEAPKRPQLRVVK